MDPNKEVSEIINDINKKFNSNFILKITNYLFLDGIETDTKDFKEEVASQLTQNS